MTAPLLIESLAKEFAADRDAIQRLVALLDAGFHPAFLARFRRAECGAMNELQIRRIALRRSELEDLERRRASILRLLEGKPDVPARALEGLRRTRDRFELEDLFLPFRRPEREVQEALDRGLGALADLLVAPVAGTHPSASEDAGSADGEAEDGEERPREGADSIHAERSAGEAEPASEPDSTTQKESEGSADAPEADHSLAAPGHDASEGEGEEDTPAPAPTLEAAIHGVDAEGEGGRVDIVVTPELVRLCQDFVKPDRGVHTEEEALAGAMRILSDRLGRNPALRGQLRRMLRKFGVLSVHPAGGDENKVGRHKALLKISQPLPQLQGHRLLQLRQAQRDRAIATVLRLDPERALPKVRAALGQRTAPEYEGVLSAVARRALERRLLPMLETDVRLDLKERADQEALRYLSSHLRQVLLTAALGPKPAAGIDTTAKGDLVVAPVDEHGAPLGAPVALAASELDDVALSEKLAEVLRPHGIRWIAMGASRVARPAVRRVRAAVRALGADAAVLLVNEAGLSQYANSELARRELPDLQAPARQAISLARRLQDPLGEFVKVDPRHLGLGFEQSLVSKTALRRLLEEQLGAAVAHVGVNLERAGAELLEHVPGLDRDKAKALVALREAGALSTRVALKEQGLLDELSWTNAASFLRLPSSRNDLDATALHPEEYEVAERVLAATGQPREAVLGRFGALRDVKPEEFGLDDAAWRDFQRELGHPGRDPRPRVFAPTLLPADTQDEALAKDQVVEGIVSSVANFGAFVDLGLEREGLVHISELGQRFVRDAREAVSVGQVVRARITDPVGPRIQLSFKNLPEREARGPRRGPREGDGEGRPQRGERREREGRGKRERRPVGQDGQWPEPQRMVRAANSRRDGMPMNPGLRDSGGRPARGEGRGGEGRDGRGGDGRGRGGARPAGSGRGPKGEGTGFGRGPRREGDEDWKGGGSTGGSPGGHNPFANFFKKDGPKPS